MSNLNGRDFGEDCDYSVDEETHRTGPEFAKPILVEERESPKRYLPAMHFTGPFDSLRDAVRSKQATLRGMTAIMNACEMAGTFSPDDSVGSVLARMLSNA